MNAHIRQLPIVTLCGERYFVDERLQELRNVQNPHDSMSFSYFETLVTVAVINLRQTPTEDPKLLLQIFTDAVAFDKARGREPSIVVKGILNDLRAQVAALNPKPARRRKLDRVR